MKAKIMALTAALIIAITSFAACSEKKSSDTDSSSSSSASKSISVSSVDLTVDPVDYEVGYSESDACKIKLDGTSAEINGDGAKLDDGVLMISKAGIYVLSGKLEGRVVVNAGKKDEVRIIFNGVQIECSDNSAFAVLQADKVTLTLEDGSTNKLTDGSEYKLSDEESKVDACLYSQDDLTVNGSGSLEITANYKHGIVSKDDLVITGGKLSISAKNTGITGKDSVKISGGEIDISSGTNGIRSDNSEDAEKGYVAISGGSIKIISGGDGIQAAAVLKIGGGTFDISTGGGSSNASVKKDGMPNENWQKDMQKGGGFRGGKRGQMQDGQTPPDMKDGQTPPDMQDGSFETQQASAVQTAEITQTADKSSDSSNSAKALKADSDIDISGGTFKIDSADDAVHSNAGVNITGGKFEISSGDDGIHADKDLSISDGEITISKSYEGLEGMTTTISGGTISVTASDDGINCAGGSDTGSENRAGRDMFTPQEGVYLKITGGNITVNANGDGLDSNGDLYVEGGTTVVYGPTNGGNGALDYNGTAKITGGSVIALGAAGMEQNFSDSSTQCSVLCDLDSTVEAGTELTITDSSGNVVFKTTNAKTWQGVVFSSGDIKQGEKYTLKAGNQTKTIEVTSVITTDSKGNQFGMGGGRMR